ncbi:hypothetical protein BJY00DRAFT_311398 [Aspergillus carlsbadensis]|nr:hypothetical protein BJY00DRAFT_311398 [Aspergillus carlsbadensis]
MNGTLLTVRDWAEFLEALETWLDSSALRSREQEVPFWTWQDEVARLRVWADDIDFSQTREDPSLDEVLSKLPLVKRQISRELARIRRLVRDIEEELSDRDDGGTMDPEIYSDSESDDDKETTVLQDIYLHLKDSIDGLNRMSIIISQRRSPANQNKKSDEARKRIVQSGCRHHRPRLEQELFFKGTKEDITKRLLKESLVNAHVRILSWFDNTALY